MVPEIYGECQGKFLDIGAGRASQIIIIIMNGYSSPEIVELKFMSTLWGEESNGKAFNREHSGNW